MRGRFGYLSSDPCRVCSTVAPSNQMHPRYGYVVCADHQVTPVDRIPPLPRKKKKQELSA